MFPFLLFYFVFMILAIYDSTHLDRYYFETNEIFQVNRLIYLTEWIFFLLENQLQSNTKMRVFDFTSQQRMTYIPLSVHNTHSRRCAQP